MLRMSTGLFSVLHCYLEELKYGSHISWDILNRNYSKNICAQEFSQCIRTIYPTQFIDARILYLSK